MVRELTLDPSITTLNMALKTIVSDLGVGVGGDCSGGYIRAWLPCCYATHWHCVGTMDGGLLGSLEVCATGGRLGFYNQLAVRWIRYDMYWYYLRVHLQHT